MHKDKPEFEYLTLDTMKIVTRGEGVQFEPDTETIERLNSLASSETSKLFCPSYTKTKAKRKQGRPRKFLPKVSEGMKDITTLHTTADSDREHLENAILTTP